MPYRLVIMSVRAGIAKSMGGDSTRGRQNAKRERSEFIGVAKSIGITRSAESVCEIVTGGGNTEWQLYDPAAARCRQGLQKLRVAAIPNDSCMTLRRRGADVVRKKGIGKPLRGFPMPFFFRPRERRAIQRQSVRRHRYAHCTAGDKVFSVVLPPCRTAPAKARSPRESPRRLQ